jgi:hypothetical protein
MESTPKQNTKWRMVVAAVFIVIYGILLGGANYAVWFGTTLSSTDNFVATFSPLPGDPAVATALGAEIGNAVVENNDVEGLLNERLPEGIGFIAAPLTDAFAGLIAGIATDIINSDAFSTVWTAILTGAHKAALLVVQGTDKLDASDGTVSLDFSETFVLIQERLEEAGVDVFEGEEISATVVVYENDTLGTFQSIVQGIEAVRWIVPIAALLFLLAAVGVANDRRRAAFWLAIATIISMVLVLIQIRYLRSTTVSDIADPVQRAGAEAAWSIVFDRLLAQTWALVLVGAIVSFAAWVMGESPRAASMRARYENRKDSLSENSVAEPSAFSQFIADNKRLLQWVVVALAVVFLLWIPTLRPWVIIAALVIVIAGVGVIEYLTMGGSDETIDHHSDSTV